MGGAALVLGGGGPVGGAWLTGVLAGLADAGVNLARADLVIGTSAGAVFGTRLAHGEPPRELYERQLTGADRLLLDVTTAQTLRFLWAALGSRDPERSIRRLGRAALGPRSGADALTLVRQVLRGAEDWPARDLRLAAVNARTGVVAAHGSDSGLTMVEAVAASCAVPLVLAPVAAAGQHWMDGGTRSTANLQLARGYERVLSVAPVDKAVGPHPSASRQAMGLTAEGATVSLLTPDAASRRAMGRDLTADAHRVAAALAGHAQATKAAETVGAAWQG
ncbi:patatin-like phospholipase family protein [Streptomyces justiciae]|uniref:patatin-like phospholipase family protein n=1 Tax=Streptomyces justiciae TaxID=2780140 RepID=UPI00187E7C28|nr:patatin-like phospholipase family protein [Streptomyces justiciae]MBE8472195.1 patatin-like phospholipase family protein [Streptomyces justiciae]MCW8375923.1 patatin-like phospholipase family protein [Streptomyces justiciae]